MRLSADTLSLGVSAVLSVAVNAAVLVAVDRAFTSDAHFSNNVADLAKLERQRFQNTEFEYVETPPVLPLAPPESPKKISDQDALASDLKAGEGRSTTPSVPHQGSHDQLAQTQKKDSAVPAPAPSPVIQELPVPATDPLEPKSSDTPEFAAPKPQTPPPSPPGETSAPPEPIGRDKINTNEMSRLRSSGAKLSGITSFEATGSGMGEYMKNVKEKIWLDWFPYLAFKYPIDFAGADAILSLTIDKSGEIRMVRVVQSSGSALFADYCVESVQRVANFGPLPAELLALIGKDQLEILFAFHYK